MRHRLPGPPKRLASSLAAVAALAVALAGAPPALGYGHASAVAAVQALRVQYGLPAIPAARYASLGVDDWELRRSDATTAAEEIGTWPELLALALDPRATGIAARDTAVGVTMRVAVDASQPLAGPATPERSTRARRSGSPCWCRARRGRCGSGSAAAPPPSC